MSLIRGDPKFYGRFRTISAQRASNQDGKSTIADAVGISGGRVAAVGVHAALRDIIGPSTMTPNPLYGLETLGGRAISVRRVLDAGIPAALSTDNVPCSMLWTMWEALARWNRRPAGPLGESYFTREEAPRLSVQSGHYRTWEEGQRGSIEGGRWADLAVLDDGPLGCRIDELPRIAVEMVLLSGTVIYERNR